MESVSLFSIFIYCNLLLVMDSFISCFNTRFSFLTFCFLHQLYFFIYLIMEIIFFHVFQLFRVQNLHAWIESNLLFSIGLLMFLNFNFDIYFATIYCLKDYFKWFHFIASFNWFLFNITFQSTIITFFGWLFLFFRIRIFSILIQIFCLQCLMYTKS